MKNINNVMNREGQMELQKIVQAKNNRAAELFEQILNSELFPDERLTPEWKWKVVRASKRVTPLSQKVGLGDFAKVVNADFDNGITLFQFGVLNNCLEAASFDDLGFTSTADYQSFMTDTVDNIKWYGERVAAIRKEIEIKVEQEFMMKAQTSNGLKAVKAEA